MKRKSVRLEWQGKDSVPSSTPSPLIPLAEIRPASADETPALNRLFIGDNLSILQSLLSSNAGSFRTIYIDPPFATGKGFARRIGREEDSRKPETWLMGEGYSDSWNSFDEYLSMLQQRLVLMRELLADDGTLFLHLDWRTIHYAKVMLDEIFGADRFLNEIIWLYHGPSPVRSYFNRKHDTILAYAKGSDPFFQPDRVRVPYHPSTKKTFASSPKAGFGKMPDLERGKIPEDWWYFPVTARLHNERTGFPTQKPEALLERILLTASEKGDLIGDFFCGSGTTLRVADSLERRWMGSDVQWQAIHTCQRRLALAKSHPYAIQALFGEEKRFRGEANLKCRIEQAGKKVSLSIDSMEACGPEGFPESVDYWEADFDYDGTMLRSRQPVARGWRGGDFSLSREWTYLHPGDYNIVCRAVSSAGDVGWFEGRAQIGE